MTIFKFIRDYSHLANSAIPRSFYLEVFGASDRPVNGRQWASIDQTGKCWKKYLSLSKISQLRPKDSGAVNCGIEIITLKFPVRMTFVFQM